VESDKISHQIKNKSLKFQREASAISITFLHLESPKKANKLKINPQNMSFGQLYLRNFSDILPMTREKMTSNK